MYALDFVSTILEGNIAKGEKEKMFSYYEARWMHILNTPGVPLSKTVCDILNISNNC